MAKRSSSTGKTPKTPRRTAAQRDWDRGRIAAYALKAYSQQDITDAVNAELAEMAKVVRSHEEEEPADAERRSLINDPFQPRTISQPTVSRDLKALQKQWKESALVDYDSARKEELRRIDQLVREYWRCIEQDREGTKTTSKKVKSMLVKKDMLDDYLRELGVNRPPTERKLMPYYTETLEKVTQRNADPRYLQGIAMCIKMRMDILGMVDPAKENRMRAKVDIVAVEITTPGGYEEELP